MMQQTFVKGLLEGRSVSFYKSGTIQQMAIYEKVLWQVLPNNMI